MIHATIDGIARELHQINNSCFNLGLYGEVIHQAYDEHIDIVKNQHRGKPRIRKFENMYMELKEREIMLYSLEGFK